jgi:catechol 2,3-dioxygenase-like lactoylglutathione lyase family enzyme
MASPASAAPRSRQRTVAAIRRIGGRMKRFHVHVGVTDLDANIRFYSNLFGAGPTVRKTDYAKWMVDEPRINFAISVGAREGVSHLGLEGDSADELADIRQSFVTADPQTEDEPNAACCYSRSDKHWATDPQGIRWEAFHSRGRLEDEPEARVQAHSGAACCSPGDASTGAREPGQSGAACCASREASSGTHAKAASRCCG